MSETEAPTAAEGEMRNLLRKIVKRGWSALASDESLMCYYCGTDAEYVTRPKHRKDCLFVRAKELLAKYPASHA